MKWADSVSGSTVDCGSIRACSSQAQPSIDSAIRKEHDIWNYPLCEEILYVTDWTTPNINVLWHYYETVRYYI